MEKKIAVCISGEMRYFRDPNVIEGYKKFLEIHNPDVFISTWNHIGVSMNHGYINPNEIKPIDLSIEDSIKNIYSNIKGLNIENYNDWFNSIDESVKKIVYESDYVHRSVGSYSSDECDKLTINCYTQMYKIYDSIRLKSNYENLNSIKYDIVIRMRPDNLFVNHFDFNINKNTIYNQNFGLAFHPNRIYDIFFYGDSESMDKIGGVFFNFCDLLKYEFDNGLCNRDACRILYLQSILSNLDVTSVKTRLTDTYRGQGYEYYRRMINVWGEINNN